MRVKFSILFPLFKGAAETKRQLRFLSEYKLCLNVILYLGHRNTNLLHSISVTNGYATVVLCIKVVGNAEGCTDLILTTISLTDRTGFVEVAGECFSKLIIKLKCLFGKLLGKRKNCRLNGCKSGMKVKNHSYVIFTDGLLIISVNEDASATLSAPREGSTT